MHPIRHKGVAVPDINPVGPSTYIALERGDEVPPANRQIEIPAVDAIERKEVITSEFESPNNKGDHIWITCSGWF